VKPKGSSSDWICLRGLLYRMTKCLLLGSPNPTTRSVLPASFCNVNVVDFCSGSTWFETQLELLVSLRGIVSQSLPVRTSNWRLPLSNPYASSVISRPVTLNEPICYSTKCHSTTISLISSAINRFSSRCRVLSRILSEKSLALLTGHWLFRRWQGPLLALYGIVDSSLSVYS
jgi:hypothetical protein